MYKLYTFSCFRSERCLTRGRISRYFFDIFCHNCLGDDWGTTLPIVVGVTFSGCIRRRRETSSPSTLVIPTLFRIFPTFFRIIPTLFLVIPTLCGVKSRDNQKKSRDNQKNARDNRLTYWGTTSPDVVEVTFYGCKHDDGSRRPPAR